MLVLTRKTNERIKIGEDIVITVVRVRGGTVGIGIEAPTELNISRHGPSEDYRSFNQGEEQG